MAYTSAEARQELLDALRHSCTPWPRLVPRSRTVVLVVSPDPELGFIVLVTPLRRPVEDRVVAHQELQSTGGGRVGVVDGAVLHGEGTHPGSLGDVAGHVGPG